MVFNMENCMEFDVAKIAGNLDLLDKTVRNVVELLIEKNYRISTAESCTGGLLSELITNVPGASSAFPLGVCTYSEDMKKKLLGVGGEILSEHGVYSSQVASAMAEGVRKLSGSDFGVGVTGIAGPTGAVDGKPVGTVYFSVSYPDGCDGYLLPLDRIGGVDRKLIRRYTALAVFTQLEQYLENMERN